MDKLSFQTNLSIRVDMLLGPLMEIRADFREGKNPYICRERYRAWTETALETLGSVDLPNWELLIELDEDRWFWTFFDQYDSHSDYHWALYTDADVPVGAALEKLDIDHTAEDLLETLMELSPPDCLIILEAPEYGAFYVLRSPDISYRGAVGWASYLTDHPFEDIADAQEWGDIDTYVLPDLIALAWKKEEYNHYGPSCMEQEE